MKTITPTPPAHCTFDPEDWLRLARCWHPVARACDIAGAPVKATLLDEQLVIYRIKGQVVVARDVCPHRGVPLTLGFHEEEGIVCPYHGLRFGEDGRCNRIPSSPGQPIPAKLHLTSFAVEERYGLIWTCLACDPDNPPPLPTMPHWDDAGFQQINCPASSDFRAPEGFQWLRHFEMHLPFTATLTIHFPADARLVIMNAASPVSSRVTRMFAPIARNFDLHVPVEDVHAFNLRVFEEDRLMVETQRPERLPLDLTLEAHIPADRSSIAYRRGLKKMGFGDFFLV